MSDLLVKLDGGQIIAILAISGGLLCALVGIIVGGWEKVRRTEINAALKQEMLNRGMSTEDIRVVLDAGTKYSRKEYRKQNTGSG